jgi:biotin operon repressor
MSWAAVAWAVRQRLPSTQKLVLIMLAERHNKDTGRCDPSHERLAEDCGLTRRSVMDQVKRLEEAGYICAMARAKGKLKMSNHYVLNLSFGVPETVKQLPDDPFLVVNDVHQGGEARSPGVVNHVPKVVNDVHQGGEARSHKPVTEPRIEPANTEANASLSASTLPDCPHGEIIELFAKHLPALPQPKAELWDGQRAKSLRARWIWVLTAKKTKGEHAGQPYATDKASALAWFGRFFAYVAEKCPHLTGTNDRGWTADLGWLVKSDNFSKVLQGNYQREAA